MDKTATGLYLHNRHKRISLRIHHHGWWLVSRRVCAGHVLGCPVLHRPIRSWP